MSTGIFLRRVVSVLFIFGFFTVIAGMHQSVVARPVNSAGETQTPTPTATSYPARSLIINEVAWMGTLAEPASEWIELKNPGTTPISLKGWKLSSASKDIDVFLLADKFIEPGGYYLLGRKFWDTDTNGPFSDITPDQLYYDGKPLSDSGDSLVLLDPSGATVDTANSMGGRWPAGYSSYERKCSMERGGDNLLDQASSWLTNIGGVAGNGHDISGYQICGTPGQKNWADGITPTPADTPTSSPTKTPTATYTPSPSRTKTPTATSYPDRAVIINEVAWMGTLADPNSEWIELHNPGKTDILLEEGWTLRSKGNQLNVALHGTIKSGEYYLLARKSSIDDNTVPFSDITISPDRFYVISSQLSDSGDSLVLYDPKGRAIDTANSMNGMWPAGISTYDRKCSMERGGDNLLDKLGSWFTNIGGVAGNGKDMGNNAICGTPGEKNWAGIITPTATPRAYPVRAVIINEVAWMGTLANADSEWIELHNPGTTPISLEGWKLRSKYKELNVDLHGEIKADGYFLLARKLWETDTASPFSSDIKIDQLYYISKTLSDSGDSLVLFDPKGKTIDTANSMNGMWPAGYSSYERKCSMERGGDKLLDKLGSWFTNIGGVAGNGKDKNNNAICGTPGKKNWAAGYNPTATATTRAYPALTVIINEVAWMGTLANDGSEWIELHNPGTTPISLEGWKLRSKYKELDVALHGEIKAKGYYLLARKSSIYDTTVPFSDITISPDRFYVSSRQLSDSGDYLVLLDPKGKTVDTANRMNGMWPAGYSSYDRKCSMERGGDNLLDKFGSWLTNIGGVAGNGHDIYGNQICGTPGQKNWADGINPTATYTPTRTITPYAPYRTPTRTPTPKKSLTPTINPYATQPVVVVINEFLAQPRFDWNGDGEINTGDEFIEIINLGRGSAPLTGWRLDDQEGDSNAYWLDNITIEPLGHKTFFSSTTGILLSTGGDSVRLFKPTGQIADAYTYGFNPIADQSWCRLPDGTGKWQFGCEPSIDQSNRKAQSAIQGVGVIPAICLLQSLPLGILQAECDQPGLSFWNVDIWLPEPAFPRFIEDGEYFYILD